MKKTILALTLALSLQGLAAASAADNDYIMCPGDQLQVVVYRHTDISSPLNSTPYIVRPDGKVTFPLIGDIDVTGKTVTEFTRQLEASLAEYLVRPQVSVNILKLGTTRVYVIGEVKKPGLYELEKSHRVLDALGKAEGFTEKAAKKKIFLIRKGAEEPVLVNINNFLKKSDQSQNYVLNEGDCLYLTSNGKINIVRDIMPFVNGAYMISEIKKDN
ncbi:polysaccharide biosynthesis/export family protein [Phascolarctobacterium faecium]|jgi:polysaccharide export outer membrane protein|uniref:polysaccharide biosynthesis/export family protein n=1 Tax=Phascolarctobacterium faecium TaxID=33025 RepID=UPI00266EF138|nr:polysaccharide biosynthesis/export family protein [Phascolarctobacterium faecium]